MNGKIINRLLVFASSLLFVAYFLIVVGITQADSHIQRQYYRTSPHDTETTYSYKENMSVADWLELLQTVGVPSIVAGASFWFIRYMFDSAQKEREQFLKLDAENDSRIFDLADTSNKALGEMRIALNANTVALEHFRDTLIATKG